MVRRTIYIAAIAVALSFAMLAADISGTWEFTVETSQGGVQVLTPPSQFRGSGSTGPIDGLVLDVPAQTGTDLGCIGGQGGESIDISNASGARVTVFLTVLTAHGATVTMTWT